MQRQDLIFGVTGQSLIFDCPEGRPSSVTSVAVYLATSDDTGTAEAATTGSAAVETTPNTTLDDTSGAGQADPRQIHLTATTGCAVGRTYRATAATGAYEDIEVLEVAAADYVRVRHPLAMRYLAGATFASCRVTIGASSSWVSDQNRLSARAPEPYYRVRWEYVVGGVTYVHYSDLDLVRYPAPEHGVTAADVERIAPGWLDRLPTQHRADQGRALIDEAYMAVRFDLQADGIGDEAVRDRDAMRQAVRLQAIAMGLEAAGNMNAAMLEPAAMARKRYDAFYGQQFRAARTVPTATSGGGAAVRTAGGLGLR